MKFNKLSPLIRQQIPDYIFNLIEYDADKASMVTFLEYYYKWLEQGGEPTLENYKNIPLSLVKFDTFRTLKQQNLNLYLALSSIKDMRDIDETNISYIESFVKEYFSDFPLDTLQNIRNSQRFIKNFYENKGNEHSFDFLFRMIFNESIDISYPIDEVIRPSDSKYKIRYTLRVEIEDSVDLKTEVDKWNSFVGRRIYTDSSSAIIDSYYKDTVYSNDKLHKKNIWRVELIDLVIDKDKVISKMVGIPYDENTDFNDYAFLDGNNISVELADGQIDSFSCLSGIIAFEIGGSNWYPNQAIIASNDHEQGSWFGGKFVVSEMEDMTMIENENISSSYKNVNFVNSFFDVYDLEVDIPSSGSIIGLDSGATADFYYVSGRLWIENIVGEFISDDVTGEDFSSELVEIVGLWGTEITIVENSSDNPNEMTGQQVTDSGYSYEGDLNEGLTIILYIPFEKPYFKLKKKYDACRVSALSDSNGLLYGGKGYNFNPYAYTIGSDGTKVSVLITGLGKIKKLKVENMGFQTSASNATFTLLDGNSVGYGISIQYGYLHSEKYVENDGKLLGSGAVIRDSRYYQEFSYQINSDIDIAEWRDIIERVLHPAGMVYYSGLNVYGNSQSPPFPLSLTPNVADTQIPVTYALTIPVYIPVTNDVSDSFESVDQYSDIETSIDSYINTLESESATYGVDEEYRLFFRSISTNINISDIASEINVVKGSTSYTSPSIDISFILVDEHSPTLKNPVQFSSIDTVVDSNIISFSQNYKIEKTLQSKRLTTTVSVNIPSIDYETSSKMIKKEEEYVCILPAINIFFPDPIDQPVELSKLDGTKRQQTEVIINIIPINPQPNTTIIDIPEEFEFTPSVPVPFPPITSIVPIYNSYTNKKQHLGEVDLSVVVIQEIPTYEITTIPQEFEYEIPDEPIPQIEYDSIMDTMAREVANKKFDEEIEIAVIGTDDPESIRYYEIMENVNRTNHDLILDDGFVNMYESDTSFTFMDGSFRQDLNNELNNDGLEDLQDGTVATEKQDPGNPYIFQTVSYILLDTSYEEIMEGDYTIHGNLLDAGSSNISLEFPTEELEGHLDLSFTWDVSFNDDSNIDLDSMVISDYSSTPVDNPVVNSNVSFEQHWSPLVNSHSIDLSDHIVVPEGSTTVVKYKVTNRLANEDDGNGLIANSDYITGNCVGVFDSTSVITWNMNDREQDTEGSFDLEIQIPLSNGSNFISEKETFSWAIVNDPPHSLAYANYVTEEDTNVQIDITVEDEDVDGCTWYMEEGSDMGKVGGTKSTGVALNVSNPDPTTGKIHTTYVPDPDRFFYQPEDLYVEQFKIYVVDSAGKQSDSEIYNVEITPVDDPPFARNTTWTVPEDAIGNDTDLTLHAVTFSDDLDIDTPLNTLHFNFCQSDGTALTLNPQDLGGATVSMVEVGGVVTINLDTDVTELATPQFYYKVNDRPLDSNNQRFDRWSENVGIVTIVVTPIDDPVQWSIGESPISGWENNETPADGFTFNLPSANDVDNPEREFEYSVSELSSNFEGTIEKENDPTEFRWKPNTSNYDFHGDAGTAVFQVSWGTGPNDNLSSGDVTITVNNTNDTPIATPQEVEVDEDSSIPITLAGTDVDDSSLTLIVKDVPTEGTLEQIEQTDTYTYTPAGDFHGTDSFTFTAKDDDNVESEPATVNITINPQSDNPEASDVIVTVDEDSSNNAITLSYDDPDPTGVTHYKIKTIPSAGGGLNRELDVWNPIAESLTYTPTSNLYGIDHSDAQYEESFTYQVKDGQNNVSNTATVNINITGVSDNPIASIIGEGVAATNRKIVNEDSYVLLTGIGGTDADFLLGMEYNLVDKIVYIQPPGYNTNNPSMGNRILDSAGNAPSYGDYSNPEDINTDYYYHPAPNTHGDNSFTFKVGSQNVANGDYQWSASKTYYIRITSDNSDLPIANQVPPTGREEVDEDSSINITLDGQNPIHDTDVLEYKLSGGPENGSVTRMAAGVDTAGDYTTNHILTYTPSENYNGEDQFEYTVRDADSERIATANVLLTVLAIDDPPVIVSTESSTHTDVGETKTWTFNATDDTDNEAIDWSTWEFEASGGQTPGFGTTKPTVTNNPDIAVLEWTLPTHYTDNTTINKEITYGFKWKVKNGSGDDYTFSDWSSASTFTLTNPGPTHTPPIDNLNKTTNINDNITDWDVSSDFTDSPMDKGLAWSIHDVPTSMTSDDPTIDDDGKISWITNATDGETEFEFTVRATDGGEGDFQKYVDGTYRVQQGYVPCTLTNNTVSVPWNTSGTYDAATFTAVAEGGYLASGESYGYSVVANSGSHCTATSSGATFTVNSTNVTTPSSFKVLVTDSHHPGPGGNPINEIEVTVTKTNSNPSDGNTTRVINTTTGTAADYTPLFTDEHDTTVTIEAVGDWTGNGCSIPAGNRKITFDPGGFAVSGTVQYKLKDDQSNYSIDYTLTLTSTIKQFASDDISGGGVHWDDRASVKVGPLEFDGRAVTYTEGDYPPNGSSSGLTSADPTFVDGEDGKYAEFEWGSGATWSFNVKGICEGETAGEGETTGDTFTVSGTWTNDSPVWSDVSQSLTEDAGAIPVTETARLYSPSAASDANSDTLSLEVSDNDNVTTGSGNIYINAKDEDISTSSSFKYYYEDGFGGKTSEITVTFTVTMVNTQPTADFIPDEAGLTIGHYWEQATLPASGDWNISAYVGDTEDDIPPQNALTVYRKDGENWDECGDRILKWSNDQKGETADITLKYRVKDSSGDVNTQFSDEAFATVSINPRSDTVISGISAPASASPEAEIDLDFTVSQPEGYTVHTRIKNVSGWMEVAEGENAWPIFDSSGLTGKMGTDRENPPAKVTLEAFCYIGDVTTNEEFGVKTYEFEVANAGYTLVEESLRPSKGASPNPNTFQHESSSSVPGAPLNEITGEPGVWNNINTDDFDLVWVVKWGDYFSDQTGDWGSTSVATSVPNPNTPQTLHSIPTGKLRSERLNDKDVVITHSLYYSQKNNNALDGTLAGTHSWTHEMLKDDRTPPAPSSNSLTGSGFGSPVSVNSGNHFGVTVTINNPITYFGRWEVTNVLLVEIDKSCPPDQDYPNPYTCALDSGQVPLSVGNYVLAEDEDKTVISLTIQADNSSEQADPYLQVQYKVEVELQWITAWSGGDHGDQTPQHVGTTVRTGNSGIVKIFPVD